MGIRTTPPSTINKYYIHHSKGGYNSCIRITGNSCLPNCVGYAYGRCMEMAGLKSCNLPTCNAEDWYSVAKSRGFKVGKTPKPGAVICWSKGRTGYSGDGCGHVAIVEKVYSDGSILVSQSGYGSGKRMWTRRFSKGYLLSGYKFLGFIYNVTFKPKTYSGKLPAKTIKKGSKGANVKRWQEFLNWYFGREVVKVDGSFGDKTATWTKEFQEDWSLTMDAVVGTKTRREAAACWK